MIYLAVAFAFISILTLLYYSFLVVNNKKLEMMDRIHSVESMDKAWLKSEDAYGESVLSALYKSLGSLLIKLTPSYNNSRTKKTLEKAGVLRETTYEKWVARKTLVTVIFTLMAVAIMLVTEMDRSAIFFIAIVMVFFIQVMYRYYLSKRITTRTSLIIKSLPFSLDLITVSVEAGLSLDGAIARIVSNIDGPLSDEFGITLKEMRMGLSKKDALKNMSQRVGNRELSMLLSSIIQADELGVSLGKILRIEGEQFREKRKQAAKEKAIKAPVKMLFPIIIFIFPSVFIVVLGPAVIHMLELF